MVIPRRSGAWQRRDSNNHPEDGFALPTVLGVGLILLVSSLALGYSAYQANLGGIQRFQSTEAEAHAESGIAHIFNALNNQYFFLAGISNSQWTSTYSSLRTQFNAAIAGNSGLSGCLSFLKDPSAANSPLNQTSYGPANWKLISYTLNTNSTHSTITVAGRTTTGAETNVSRTYQLGQQPLGGPFGAPGLLASKVDLGNNDILGLSNGSCSGSILCANCSSVADVQRQPNSVVDGIISVGTFSWPAPSRPTNMMSLGEIKNSISLPRSGDTLANGAYSYSASLIELSGQDKITINPYAYGTTPTPDCTVATNKPSTCHPVVIYLTGNMKLGGQSEIINNGGPEDFIILGNNRGGAKQDITLNGSAKANIFIYAPTAEVGIDGGGNQCKSDAQGQGPCNITGAIWSDAWGRSSSNVAAIRVPGDLSQRLSNSSVLSFLANSLPSSSILTTSITTFYRIKQPVAWQRGS